MVFFSDFGKTVKDLFDKKKYEVNKTLKVTCKSKNSEWSTESSFPVKAEGMSTTKSKYQQTLPYGTVLVEVPSNKPGKLDYQTPALLDGLKSNLVMEGSKLSYKGKYSAPQAKAAALKAKTTVSTSTMDPANVSLQAEISTELQGLHVGGEVSYNANKGFTALAAGAHYVKDGTQLTLKTDNKFDLLTVMLHKKYSDNGEVAASYDLDLKSYYAHECSVGGAWTIDDKSMFQGFVKSDGNAYALYKYKLSDRLTAHLGTSFNVRKLDDDLNMHYKFEFAA